MWGAFCNIYAPNAKDNKDNFLGKMILDTQKTLDEISLESYSYDIKKVNNSLCQK